MDKYILDLLHPSLLAQGGVGPLFDHHAHKWGGSPSALMFPVTTDNGVTYGSSIAPVAQSGNDRTCGLEAVAQFCASRSLDLWLLFDVEMSFVQSEAAHKKTFQGQSVGSCCIVSPATHRAFQMLLKEVLATLKPIHVPIGTVLPVQDLWGMSAENEVINLTCFCSYCTNALTKKGVDLSLFSGHPNPWGLVLKDATTGVDHIEQLTPDLSPEGIVQLSVGKNFYAREALQSASQRATDEEERRRLIDKERTKLLHWAEILKSYVDAANDMTKEALAKYSGEIRQAGMRSAVIVDSSPYDWSSRLYFDRVDDPELADEVWVEPSNRYSAITQTSMRQYLCMRGRYVLDALFEVVDTFHSRRLEVLSDFSAGRRRNLFRRRARTALHSLYCVFRAIPAADSGRCRPAIPVITGHRFRRKPATWEHVATLDSAGPAVSSWKPTPGGTLWPLSDYPCAPPERSSA